MKGGRYTLDKKGPTGSVVSVVVGVGVVTSTKKIRETNEEENSYAKEIIVNHCNIECGKYDKNSKGTHHLNGNHEVPVCLEKLESADDKYVHTTGSGSVLSVVVRPSARDV